MSTHPDDGEMPTMSGSRRNGGPSPPGAGHGEDHEAYPGFEVKGEIGRGGFGAVHLAREGALKRDIALKTSAGPKRADPKRLKRFLEEACITAQLQHPGIVPVYRLEEDRFGRPYYTMRPIEGRPLSSILAKLKADDAATLDRFPLRRLVRILHAVCQTVRFAHDRGVIHRDLKPGNIVIGDYGEVMVIDWGLAKVLPADAPAAGVPGGDPDEADQGVRRLLRPRVESLRGDKDSSFQATLNGTFMGTPPYASPEQASGRTEDIDARSDVWSLGVVLYELCTLRRPFEAETIAELVRLIATTDPPDPMRADPRRRVPPELAQIALRCLKRKKADRCATVGELAEDLENWLEGIAPWRVVADVNFSDFPDGSPEGWTALKGDWIKGQWSVEKGLLKSPELEGVLLLDVPAAGEVRVEVQAMVVQGRQGEISPLLDAPVPGTGRSPYEGYCMQFGADYNTCAKISKNIADMMKTQAASVAGQWHTVVAEHVGNVLRLAADGDELLRWRDYVPLHGQRVGLYGCGEGLRVRAFRVLSRGVPVTVSCLAVPNAFYNEGLIDKAKSEYLRVADSHPGREEASEALFLAGKCDVELAGRGTTKAADRERLLADARRCFDRLEESNLAPLGCLGKSMIHESRNEPEKEAAELIRAFEDYRGYETLNVVGERLWERAIALQHRPAVHLFAIPAARLFPEGLWTERHIATVASAVDKEAAREILGGFIRRSPEMRQRCAFAQLNLGHCLRFEHRFEEAVHAYEKTIRDYPELRDMCAEAAREIGSTYARQGRYDKAMAAARRALAECADRPDSSARLQVFMGWLLGRLRRYDEAQRSLERVRREYPGQRSACARAMAGMAQILTDQGRYEEARALCSRLLDEYPDQASQCVLALGARRNAFMLEGRYDEAVEQSQESDWPPELLTQAALHALRGERREVLEVLRRLADEHHDLFCRAALHPDDAGLAAEVQRLAIGDWRTWYDRILALAAYARGDDRTAIRHLRDSTEQMTEPMQREVAEILLAKLAREAK